MAYEFAYRGEFKNTEDQLIIIHISDTTSGFINPTVFTDFTPVSCEMSVVNDNDSKYGIRSKRIDFNIQSSDVIDISPFLDGEDNRWLVDLFVNNISVKIFTGFLVVDDMKEAFLDNGLFQVSMSATDNLGLLRDIPLTDLTGTNPKGKHRLIDYIIWALSKTNLSLGVSAAFNLFEEHTTGLTDATFDKIYLDAVTFEKEIGESEDCHTVLNKILTGCELFQEQGTWYIVRLDEIGAPLRFYNFDAAGNFFSVTEIDKEKLIGRDELLKLSQADAQVLPERPYKYTRQTFNFRTPSEVPANKDFSRGDWMSLIVPNVSSYLFIIPPPFTTLPSTGVYDVIYYVAATNLYYEWNGSTYTNLVGVQIPYGKAYNLDDWTSEMGSVLSPSISDATAYIKRVFIGDIEKERYATIPSGGASNRKWIKSSPIPVSTKDRFQVSVDFAYDSDITGSSQTLTHDIQIMLNGENGVTYVYGNDYVLDAQGDYRWAVYVPGNPHGDLSIRTQWNRSTTDERTFQSVSADVQAVPVSGELVFRLYRGPSETHYQNFSFNYEPFIAGSYKKYTGQYNQVKQAGNYRAKAEEEIFASDSPRRLFKGSLYRMDGSIPVLTSKWYDYLAGTTGAFGFTSIGKYQSYELWNQHHRVIRRFEGSLLGLNTSNAYEIPGLMDRYTILPDSDHTTAKFYLLLSFKQDLRSCNWSGVFADVFDDNKSLGDEYEFKYVAE